MLNLSQSLGVAFSYCNFRLDMIKTNKAYILINLPGFCLFCFLFFFRYIESMVHFAGIRHPATILDDLHGKVLNEAYQISKSTVTDSVSTEMHRQDLL